MNVHRRTLPPHFIARQVVTGGRMPRPAAAATRERKWRLSTAWCQLVCHARRDTNAGSVKERRYAERAIAAIRQICAARGRL